MSIKIFQITEKESRPVASNASTLDEMTRNLPDGFYTTFTTLESGTKVHGLQMHIDRLYSPAHGLGLDPAVDETTLRAKVTSLVRENLPNESRVRLILIKETGAIYAGVQPFEPLPEIIREKGVHVITAEMAREDPHIKNSGFISLSNFQRQRLGSDVFEVLMVKNGKILEGITSNFHGIRGNSIITAHRGILPGVTRATVLKLAKGQGMIIEYRAPHLHEKLSEAFLTSSSRGVIPIVSIDGRPVGEGRVGEQTKSLSKAYQDHVHKSSEFLIKQ